MESAAMNFKSDFPGLNPNFSNLQKYFINFNLGIFKPLT